MKHQQAKKIGLERIHRLFELAEQELEKKPERSKRYIEIAREISKKTKAKIPKELKQKFCKKCNSYLKEGKNAEITRTEKWLIIKCKQCNNEKKSRLTNN